MATRQKGKCPPHETHVKRVLVRRLTYLEQGISMSLEQYSALVSILPQIEEALVAKGEKVPRPDYSGVSSEQQGQDLNDDDNEAELKSTKANIEATSDEED